MNRSIWVMVAIAVLATVAMSMMMERALRVRDARGQSPAVAAVNRNVGARLTREPTFRTVATGGRRVGHLGLWPEPGIQLRNLAADAGATAWRALGADVLDALIVTCTVVDATTEVVHFAVPSPRQPAARLVELTADEVAADDVPGPAASR